MNRSNTGSGVVTVDDEIPRSRVDDILRSELQGKKIGGGSKRPLCDVDIGVADERPLKSVAFEVDDAGGNCLYELKRHFQREHHLRADQRFRARYHPSKVRGSDGRALYGSKLEAEKELFMHLDVPELDHKRPFYYDVVEGKPFIFTSARSRTLIQMEMLLIFLRGGGQLWTLEESGPRWECWRVILRAPLTSVGVRAIFL